MKNLLRLVAVAVFVFSAPFGHGRDWFVRAGSAGDGTKEKPFKDPYQALEEASPGDTIHVAKGVYHGRLKTANWVVSIPNLTLFGGYNEDFTRRDPWRLPSELCFSSDFQGTHNGTLIEGGGNHDNFVLDGFLLDQKKRGKEGADPYASLVESGALYDPLVNLGSSGIQIRNCVILNGAKGGIALSGDGCRIENNIIMNIAGDPLITFRSHEGKTAVLKGNTFLFSWSDRGVESGSYGGNGVSFWSSTHEFEFIDNIFLGCDNDAIFAGAAEKLSLKGNIFWLNGSANVKVNVKGQFRGVGTGTGHG